MAVKTTKEPAKSPGVSCYLGPNIHGVIQNGTIYPVGKEDALKLPEVKMALDKAPGIAVLIADGSTLPEDLIRVKQEGTDLYKAYRALKKGKEG